MGSETKEDKLRGVGTESCESECFVVIVDKEYDEEDGKKHQFRKCMCLSFKQITFSYQTY